jgi:hypothetical protein
MAGASLTEPRDGAMPFTAQPPISTGRGVERRDHRSSGPIRRYAASASRLTSCQASQ